MDWNQLTTATDIEAIIERSHQVPCLILKHSSRCSISFMALHRLEGNWDFPESQIEPYFLDLISYRILSKEVAERFMVHHESPQVLLVINGECIYDASHLDITVEAVREALAYQKPAHHG